MMEENVMLAFDIYARLAVSGQVRKAEISAYWENEEVRHFVERFVGQVQCVLISDADYLYLLPASLESPFHISNEAFKKRYMTSKAVNMDIYLLYLSIIVLFGCFYDSYQTQEPADFVSMSTWLEAMNGRIESLHRHDEETLKAAEGAMNFNWLTLMRKWDDLDSIKETARKQDARTNSRLSFLSMARSFLLQQHLVREIGNDELVLTEKARAIFANYFMEASYNNGILDFMYELDHKDVQDGEKGADDHAIHQ
ncbi:DUF6063 family protein [uncultured Mitsuokella sp.]|uniref:DUF6063 family protein n=1 Tax=uncultured Mitsuokella sp. TaxID=453120 RepID=UPI002637920E|nr:DUF6063 family protein [uncultured Mitsuokella sp.]